MIWPRPPLVMEGDHRVKRIVIAASLACVLAVLPTGAPLHFAATAMAHRASAHATATVTKGQVKATASCGHGSKTQTSPIAVSVSCKR